MIDKLLSIVLTVMFTVMLSAAVLFCVAMVLVVIVG